MRAALVILQAYRRYKVKSYIREVNRRFKNVRSMKDYGRHVKWPTPPKVLRKFEESLRSIYNRYSDRITTCCYFRIHINDCCFSNANKKLLQSESYDVIDFILF